MKAWFRDFKPWMLALGVVGALIAGAAALAFYPVWAAFPIGLLFGVFTTLTFAKSGTPDKKPWH